MLQTPVPEHAVDAATGGYNAGTTIIAHVSNSAIDEPLIHLPKVLGIDLSVTKHVLMLWIVAALLFVIVTWIVRRFVRQEHPVPGHAATLLEIVVEFVRDSIVEPNIGRKHTRGWTPLILTLFLFILGANMMGLIPVFDVLELLNHAVIHAPETSFFARMLHGGVVATGNYNVTAGLATVTFFATILAGTIVHGFVRHWKNLVPPGLPLPVTLMLIPIEILGMFVRPFALTMRLAANMTGGHVAILTIISFVFIFTELFKRAAVGMGIGLFLSLPMSVGVSALEIIVVLVQAYVFTLLSAVFIGMAIHAHH
jgi:F-type H+-transporting ATPase subunit a